MDDEEQEEYAENLRHSGWVCYRKKENPRKWIGRAWNTETPDKTVSWFGPTKEQTAWHADGKISNAWGSHPEWGSINTWRYHVSLASMEMG